MNSNTLDVGFPILPTGGGLGEWLLNFPKLELVWIVTKDCSSHLYRAMVGTFIGHIALRGVKFCYFIPGSELKDAGHVLLWKALLSHYIEENLVENACSIYPLGQNGFLNITDIIVANPHKSLYGGRVVSFRVFNPRSDSPFALREDDHELEQGILEMLAWAKKHLGSVDQIVRPLVTAL